MRADAPKFLALVTDAYGQFGGISQFNRDFLDALEAHAEITVLSLNPIDKRRATASMRLLDAQGNRARFVAMALAQSVQGRPDVVFCGHINFVYLAHWASRVSGAKLWLHVHGIDAWDCPSPRRRSGATQADLITAVSRFTRAQVLNWSAIAPDLVRVLPNTVAERFQPEQRDPAFRDSLGLAPELGPVLLTVARLSRSDFYKGVDTVIQALPELTKTYPKIQYLIAGAGDDLARLQLLAASHDVSERVHFLGAVSDAMLPKLYREADVFVMPSCKEGFGIVFIEAMASGTIAVGLNVDGSVDALADGALGRPVARSQFAAAVLDCLQQPIDRQRLSGRTREKFGREHFASLVQQLTDDLVGRTGRPERQ